jgi:hypothetical protein
MVNPFDWADPSGAVEFYGIFAIMLLVIAVQLVGSRWDDWLDERCGRGSVRDVWLLRRIERDADRTPGVGADADTGADAEDCSGAPTRRCGSPC